MSANLTKKDLVLAIHQKLQLPQKDIKESLEIAFDTIMKALLEGRNVELRNFGVFEVQVRKSRVGRNPNKPEVDVVIPERAIVKFKSGKEFKQAIKNVSLKTFSVL
ncbi:MAG: integration host factor subunit beta [Verrucomicrobia bacterium GWC2_42_7]|nr:MAG: integration host factor subunit beta [Verrucomicrobia bacterium GWC2_42_7]